ncbi:hypothetical protein Dimus_024809 [Dionaea muscipula]
MSRHRTRGVTPMLSSLADSTSCATRDCRREPPRLNPTSLGADRSLATPRVAVDHRSLPSPLESCFLAAQTLSPTVARTLSLLVGSRKKKVKQWRRALSPSHLFSFILFH